MKSRISWAEKRDAKGNPHIAYADRPFGGMPAGTPMLIPTPKLVDTAVRQLPAGKLGDIKEFRAELGRAHGAEFACPLTTGIFLRIVAEAAFEEEQQGATDVTPVWRIIDPKSPLAKKLTSGEGWLAQHRKVEGF